MQLPLDAFRLLGFFLAMLFTLHFCRSKPAAPAAECMVPEGEQQSREGLQRLWQIRGFKAHEEGERVVGLEGFGLWVVGVVGVVGFFLKCYSQETLGWL